MSAPRIIEFLIKKEVSFCYYQNIALQNSFEMRLFIDLFEL